MQQKKIVLEKANEFFIWNETLMGKLSHTEFQFDTKQAKSNLVDDMNKCLEEIKTWAENIDSIEQLLLQSKTTIPGSSITDKFKESEIKLAKIQ